MHKNRITGIETLPGKKVVRGIAAILASLLVLGILTGPLFAQEPTTPESSPAPGASKEPSAPSFPADHSYLLENQGILQKRADQKLAEMSTELREKTGVHFYLAAYMGFPDGKNIHTTAEDLKVRMEAPWVLLIFSAAEKQVDIKTSPDAREITDRDEVLDNFVIPIIVQKQKGVTELARFEAALFNGSVRILSDAASSKGVELASAPEGTLKTTGMADFNLYFWKYSFYAFIAVTFLVVLYNSRKRKRKGS